MWSDAAREAAAEARKAGNGEHADLHEKFANAHQAASGDEGFKGKGHLKDLGHSLREQGHNEAAEHVEEAQKHYRNKDPERAKAAVEKAHAVVAAGQIKTWAKQVAKGAPTKDMHESAAAANLWATQHGTSKPPTKEEAAHRDAMHARNEKAADANRSAEKESREKRLKEIQSQEVSSGDRAIEAASSKAEAAGKAAKDKEGHGAAQKEHESAAAVAAQAGNHARAEYHLGEARKFKRLKAKAT